MANQIHKWELTIWVAKMEFIYPLENQTAEGFEDAVKAAESARDDLRNGSVDLWHTLITEGESGRFSFDKSKSHKVGTAGCYGDFDCDTASPFYPQWQEICRRAEEDDNNG